jgi:phage tail-like protein
MGDVRSYVAGNFFLNLDGVKTGFLKSVDGGGIVGDVVSEASGASYYTKKHIGNVKYEDININIGFSMTKAIYDWIAASWQMNYQRKNGAVVACDYKLDAKSSRQFFNALLTETTIPACDGASKEPAYMTIKFAPEYTRVVKASGKPGGDNASFGKNEQKQWLPSNFRLELDGLDCTKVSKVDSFSIKQSTKEDEVGQDRDYFKEPGKLEVPNLKITLSQVTAQSWYDWHEDFVIKGNCFEDKEKAGRLVFLSPNRQTELAEIKFKNIGIFKLSDEKGEANNDAIKRVSAELYVEEMEFAYLNQVIA